MNQRLAAVLVCCAAAAPAVGQVATSEQDVRALLARHLLFKADDFADLDKGRIVAHSLPASAGEVAVVGAVRVRAPMDTFFARVRDIARFKRGPEVLQIGRFSSPPVVDDLAALVVGKDDFDVRECRRGDCGIRLPADAIARLSREIDQRAADAQERGAALFKQMLLEKVRAHLTGGPDPMPQYDDGSKPIKPREQFEEVLSAMPEIDELAPGLADYLRRFPVGRLSDAEDFLYWSKEKFGLDPFITVTHVTMACVSAATCVMATRDVYSSRYLDASIALAIVSQAGEGVFDLVYDNRSRADALKGVFGGLRRSIAERRARRGLEDNLKVLKKQLEMP